MYTKQRYKFIDENREEVRLYLPEYLEVSGYGMNGSGKILCPGHDDHEPSMGFYQGFIKCKCPVCGAGGDVFDMSQMLTGSNSFTEAVIDVALTVGFEVPRHILTMKEVKRIMKDAMANRGGKRANALVPKTPKSSTTVREDHEAIEEEVRVARAWAKRALRKAFTQNNDLIVQIANNLGLPYWVFKKVAWESSGIGLVGGKLAYVYPEGVKLRETFGKTRFRWLCGRTSMPWRFDRITPETTTIYLTEGESDALALIAFGVEQDGKAVVIAIPGVGFPTSWIPRVAGKSIIIWLDFDAPGQAAANRIAEELSAFGAKIRIVKPPLSNQ